ncbi:MAG: hypothetical protein AAFP92_23510, partial [Bacteroidota bacterium]
LQRSLKHGAPRERRNQVAQSRSTVNVPPAQVMPPNPKLQPQQLVQLINFLRKTWSQESPSVGLEEVELSLEACPDSPAPN